MRRWLGFIAMGALALTMGLGQAQEPGRRKSADPKKPKKDPLRAKILKLQEIQGGGQPFREQFLEGLKMRLSGVPDSFLDDVISEKEFVEFEELVVRIWKRNWKAGEIDDLLAFYETPLGRKMTKRQPRIQADIFEATQRWMAQLSPRLKEKWNQLMEDPDWPQGEGPYGEVVEKLLKARKFGNETAAIGALRTLSSVQAQFREGDREDDNSLDYAESLNELWQAGLIGDELGSGQRSGYIFSLSGSTYEWQAAATPISNKTGRLNFIVCTDGVVRFASEVPAACNSAAIQ